MDRRRILSGGAVVLASLAGGVVRAAGSCTPPTLDRAAYDRYIALFNASDPRFLDFYTSDVTLSLAPKKLEGRDGIKAFYDKLHQNISETTKVLFFCSDGAGAASKIEGTFRCIKDMDDPMFGRTIKKGESMTMRGMVLYGIKDGKFSWIDAGPTEKVRDWAPG